MPAVAEMSGNLARLAHIPDPGSDPLAVAAILLDGLDVVVVDVSPAPRRRRGCRRCSPESAATTPSSSPSRYCHWFSVGSET
ncbi:hypothetical protein [Nocardia sp. NPDC004260]